ncbi:unknown protein [Seminavis robusta]|uniref:Uncharacterized protein n=1 Tax=Seminavis robusta TaxID=568900 RepID=A0A9N8E1U4_9STRA|nr:unknown protein [Seminavis robusta]|eukprot:Sro535_g161930.1 n/a (538) ;mRNA; r:15416-17029
MSSWNPDRLTQFETQQEDETQYVSSPEIVVASRPTQNLSVPPTKVTQTQTPQKAQNDLGISPWSPWSQDQFLSLMNQDKMRRNKNSNKRKVVSTLVTSKKKASLKTASKPASAAAVLPRVTATSSPVMPPLRGSGKVPETDRRRGCCAALGNLCPYPQMECYRHKCSTCGVNCHSILPCSVMCEEGFLTCRNCMEVNASTEDELEEGNKSPDMLATQNNAEEEIVEEDDIEEEGLECEEDANEKKNQDMEELTQFLNQEKTQKERKKRGKNFTPEEDVFIVESWCSQTEDSRNGSDQRQSDFNKKLFSNYVALVDDHNEVHEEQLPTDRQQRSVVSRFSTIKHAVNKLIAVVKQNPIKSGETPEDHLARCLEMYEHNMGSKFQFVDCYHILKDFPKFSAANDSAPKKKDKDKKHKKKHHHRERSSGKRQQALNDKIDKMIESKGLSGSGGGNRTMQEAASVSEAIGHISTHLVDQVAVSQWTENDKEEYFRNDATEKKLLQMRRILKLEQEVASMQKKKKASDKKGSASSSEDEECN